MTPETGLAAARFLHLAATLSVPGAMAVRALVGPFALRPVLLPALATAIAAALLRVVLQADALGGSAWDVLTLTRFGHVLAAETALLAGAVLLAGDGGSRPRSIAGALLAAAALGLPLAAGHAAAAGRPGLALLGAAHVVAAACWIGGLLPLLLALRQNPQAARRFGALGVAAVAVLAVTAAAQAWALVGDLPRLVGTEYGRVVLLKTALLLALLVLAGFNRWRLVPAGRLHALRLSIVAEIVLGAATLAAAAQLAGLAPAAHVQPDWPFAWRPSLVALEDADLRQEIAGAAWMLAAALALLSAALALRRWRLPALATAALLVAFAVPHLDLLLVPSGRTIYYESPTGFAADSILRGARLFADHCTSCHGATATAPPMAAADLGAGHLWDHPDGELFGWVGGGIRTPRGEPAMPGFADRLDPDDIWSVIDYVRARNAGLAFSATGAWPRPLPAPASALRCAEGSEPAGRPVIISVEQEPPPDGCAAPDARGAYAILTGRDPASLAGFTFLVDAAGWLRAMLPPDLAAGQRAEAICRAVDDPVTAPARGVHIH
jgi:putative copper export protein/mono/diheme cytochrome c family protein